MLLVNLQPGLGGNFTIAVFEKNVYILYVIEIKCYLRLLVFIKPLGSFKICQFIAKRATFTILSSYLQFPRFPETEDAKFNITRNYETLWIAESAGSEGVIISC